MAQEKKPTLREIAKYPAAYAMIVLAGTLGSVLTLYSASGTKYYDNCTEEKKHLQEQLDGERNKNRELTTALLLKAGVIEQLPQTVDSLLNKK